MSDWLHVWATHEEEQELATGQWLGDDFLGVALPSRLALKRFLLVRYGPMVVQAQVMDVGPWCVDDAYWTGDGIPRAWKLKGQVCPRKLDDDSVATIPDGKGGWKSANVSNGAGIDIFPGTAKALGIPRNLNVWVSWCWL